MPQELSAEQARRACDPEAFAFTTTADLPGADGIIGQPRAVAALRFGLGMPDQGYHVYLAGVPGTGRTTAVRAFLEEAADGKPPPSDWCYVHNFQDPARPRILALPAGRGRELATDMRQLVEAAKRELPRAFEREEYTTRREEVVTAFQRQREERLERLAQRAREEGFALQLTPTGLVLIPLMAGQPMSDQDFAALTPEFRALLQRKRETLEEQVKATLKELRQMEREVRQRLEQMDREVALFAVGGLVDDLLEKYADLEAVRAYLEAVKEDMTANVDQFRPLPEESGPLGRAALWEREHAHRKYRVNLLVDNTGARGAPVVTEFNPNLGNLVGRVEKEAQFGTLVTDFTLIRAGALHRANGGYLVLQVEDVLRQPLAWEALKRCLRTREIVVEDPAEWVGLAAGGLRPEPIPLRVKVVLVGSPDLYHLLYAFDPDFRELFKVRADFDTEMDRTPEGERQYAEFIATVCRKEGLLPFTPSAVAAVVEHGSRLAEDQRKLSTRFADVVDVMRESDYWARQDRSELVLGEHVRRALEAKVYRSSLIQDRIREMIQRGVLLIDVAGAVVGQVNGLVVTTLSGYSFGRPSRITASLGIGREGLVDIEREVRLGGRIHSKGVLIVGGLLADRYAQDKPLTLSARITFEQSYSEVEGDSASSAEIY
ncbi:MAG TPA: ATP-binding protein, partial [Chloroflexota bacterium]